MTNNQPRDFDVVLGGEAPPSVVGVVLGGLEGVKNQLGSSNKVVYNKKRSIHALSFLFLL